MNGWVAYTATGMAHHDSITCVGAATTTATDTAIGAGIGCWHWGGCEARVELAHLNVVFRHVCVVSWLHRAAGQLHHLPKSNCLTWDEHVTSLHTPLHCLVQSSTGARPHTAEAVGWPRL